MAFDSREGARESARESYPHLRVDGEPPAEEEPGRSAGRLVKLTAWMTVALLVLTLRRRVARHPMGT
jgi:hypothetical protein